MLFETSAADPLAFAGITLILVNAATAACLPSARRASRVDPMLALRHD
jgi:ABC-type lipoprotein release transport system permease subunit